MKQFIWLKLSQLKADINFSQLNCIIQISTENFDEEEIVSKSARKQMLCKDSQRRIQDPVKYLRWNFSCKKSMLQTVN